MKVAMVLLRELLLTIGEALRRLRQRILQEALPFLQGLQACLQGAFLLQSSAHALMRRNTRNHFVGQWFTNKIQQSEEGWGLLCVPQCIQESKADKHAHAISMDR